MTDLRKQILTNIEREFIGPGSESLVPQDDNREIITENPRYRYSTGVIQPYVADSVLVKSELADESGTLDEEAIEELSSSFEVVNHAKSNADDAGEEEDETVSEVNRFPVRYTFGISAFVKSKSEKALRVLFSGGLYRLYKRSDYYIQLEHQYEAISELIRIYLSTSPGDIFADKIQLNDEQKTVKIASDHRIQEITQLRSAVSGAPVEIKNVLGDLANKLFAKDLYERVPFEVELYVDLSKPEDFQKIVLSGKTVHFHSNIVEMSDIEDGVYSVTLTIENTGQTSEGFMPQLYQPVLSIQAEENQSFFDFESINLSRTTLSERGELENLMLYGDKKSYAIGRFTSADWKVDESGHGIVYTSFLPNYEMPALEFNIDGIDSDILRASSYTSVTSKESIKTNLSTFVSSYEAWVADQELQIRTLHPKFNDIAREHIEKCRFSVERMRKSINFLMTDDVALDAFQIAHEAMILQRLRGDVRDKGKYFHSKKYVEIQPAFQWRPFQLAFILANYESLLNPESTERDLVDLIWVATGGGKTETYLFAIASIILYRRNRYHLSEDDEGVTVIMRYTLRLLTAQQFERASILICALEFIRREMPERYGSKEISIGLWIGGASTPNEQSEAKTIIQGLMSAGKDFKERLEESKMQVLKCPWCQEEYSLIPEKPSIDESDWGYRVVNQRLRKNPNNHNFVCTNPNCDFHETGNELPIYVVDETIYKVRPTLVFGTVDKFAMIALRDKTISLFGNDRKQGRNPELIIQDELHLISGPLGTTVGLYESAIDYAVSYKGVKPKIIASTATIKNAQQQVRALYDRSVFQFPPQGLRGSDSYFVRETDKKPGRLYVGLTNSNRSLVKLQSKFLAATLQYTTQLDYSTEEEADRYWTLVGYFNRIIDVGRTNYLLTDIVQQFQKGYVERNSGSVRRINPTEITSKIPSGKIPGILDNLFTTRKKPNEVIDVVSASNMISVGLDVPRLNHMYVMGQPKSTSEYIQATSRVGRENPGIVTVLLNGLNPRDLSNYERFINNHEKIYQYVESASVTPFSVPSVQRSLHGTLVAMLRNTNPELSEEESVVNLGKHNPSLRAARNFIISRARAVDVNGLNYEENVTEFLDNFTRYWQDLILDFDDVKYSGQSEDYEFLLKDQYEAQRSMRDVESPTYLKRRFSK
jgi:hypothetical protein